MSESQYLFLNVRLNELQNRALAYVLGDLLPYRSNKEKFEEFFQNKLQETIGAVVREFMKSSVVIPINLRMTFEELQTIAYMENTPKFLRDRLPATTEQAQRYFDRLMQDLVVDFVDDMHFAINNQLPRKKETQTLFPFMYDDEVDRKTSPTPIKRGRGRPRKTR
jgi:hypothetical protein